MNLLSLIPGIGTVVDKVLGLIPDVNERARAEAEFNKMLLDAVVREGVDNRDTNKVEAAHRSIFVSGWRPFIGWVCGAALCFQYLVRPFWVWGAAVWLPNLTPLGESTTRSMASLGSSIGTMPMKEE